MREEDARKPVDIELESGEVTDPAGAPIYFDGSEDHHDGRQRER
jgi:hypothetical protein